MFAGLANGKLLDAAEASGFEVLITGDKTLHNEQNLKGRKIALASLSALNWPLIEPHALNRGYCEQCRGWIIYPN